MKYFTIDEMMRSTTARRLGIDNRADARVQSAMVHLIDSVLDPLREAWGQPITVTSGYRCAELNKAVRGAANSQHLRGEAADITTGSVTGNIKLFRLVQELGLPFDQLIDEHGYAWVHVSHKAQGVNRGEVLHL